MKFILKIPIKLLLRWVKKFHTGNVIIIQHWAFVELDKNIECNVV